MRLETRLDSETMSLKSLIIFKKRRESIMPTKEQNAARKGIIRE
jgi:hypothetical protein